MCLQWSLLLILGPLVELALLLWIAEKTSWQFALLLVIASGVLGSWLVRRAGVRCWWQLQAQLARGELPTDQLLDGLLILVAGALLVLPGVLSDLAALALLVPPVRRRVKAWLVRRFRARFVRFGPCGGNGQPPAHDEIIDVPVIDAEHRQPSDDQ